MKFSEIEINLWDEHREYLDTCLLPFTGLTGEENPMETTKALEELRDMLDLVEIPFNGRVVTYPTVHFHQEEEQLASYLNNIRLNLKKQGFTYLILITHQTEMDKLKFQEFDLFLMPDEKEQDLVSLKDEISNKVQALWNNKSGKGESV
ncbi:DUF2487 family protein [Chengkuizengella axinellae]|uniref:DUF2487 family protein n=1 Tax=Chengkuizengella axinellae TaxID=3064388 RepID=A0ABT9IWS3_9BACL|nr:DUF2487 family protein [Chengkuizengella sp. 2205SS18-9]MDP5273821.1 DUF2487 family protein [Chengkuizengella sp. 2205SS18-9]